MPKVQGLTQKQKDFCDEYQKNGGNGTKAALKTYDTDNYDTASSIAKENIRKPQIKEYLTTLGRKARSFLERVMDGDDVDGKSPDIKTRVDVSKFLDDKAFGKAQQQVDVTTAGEKIQFNVINYGDDKGS